jgi:hypothetical protein
MESFLKYLIWILVLVVFMGFTGALPWLPTLMYGSVMIAAMMGGHGFYGALSPCWGRFDVQ